MHVIAGLGNPGILYQRTRHNAGFQALDRIAEDLHIRVTKRGFSGIYGEGIYRGERVVLVKPTTYMNLSGNCIQAALHFYKCPAENLIVLFDDIELGASALKYIAFSRASVERVRKWKPAIDLAITAPTYLSNPARANSTMWFNMDKTTSKDALEILDDGDQYQSGFEDYTSLGRYVTVLPYLTDERTFYWFNDTKLFSGPQAASLSCNELIFIAAEEDPYIFGKSNVTDIAITRSDKLVQSSFNATVGGEGFVTFNVKIALAPEFSNTRESVP